MVIYPKKFKKVILVGLDLDLVSELKKNNIKIRGYTSNAKKKCSYKFFGSIKNLKIIERNTGLLLCDHDLELKKFVYKKYKDILCTFVSKKAIVSNLKNIGKGSIIQSNVFLSENTKIGKCVKINVGTQLHHDVAVGDFSIFGPGCIVLGNTIIGKNCFIGSSSVIRNKIKVQSGAFIRMGSVVTTSVKK
jgi:carbonic anhydrase/acetyltransferase-like protein (isoleucine patch superfamily)